MAPPPISNDPYFYSSSRVHKVPLEVLGTWVPLERRYWEGVHRWSGGMRVGLLPILGGSKESEGEYQDFFGGEVEVFDCNLLAGGARRARISGSPGRARGQGEW